MDEHTPGFSNSPTSSLSSSSYSNHYGGSVGFDNFDGAGYGTEDLFGGSHGISHQADNPFSNFGLDFGKGNAAEYGQQEYSNTQNSLIFNNPFFLTKNQLHGLRQMQAVSQKLQIPSLSYPRAHRIPTKTEGKNNLNNLNNMIANYQQQAMEDKNNMNNMNSMIANYQQQAMEDKKNMNNMNNMIANFQQQAMADKNYLNNMNNMIANYQQQQAILGYNYSNNTPASELNTNMNSENNGGGGVNYNTGMQQSGNYNQGQTNGYNDLYYQNNNVNNQMSSANSLSTPTLKLPLENINKQFSQPLYDPSAYAEYAMNQQNPSTMNQQQQSQQQQQPSEFHPNYSQPYTDQQSSQSEMLPQSMMVQAPKSQYYNQHPENAYSVGYNSNYQTNGANNIHNTPDYDTYNNQKSPFTGKGDFDYNSAYNGNKNFAKYNQDNKHNPSYSEEISPPFQSNQQYQSSWPNNNYNQNLNTNVMPQMQQYNQQQSKMATKNSNLNYNQGFNNYNSNPMGYNNAPEGYQQTSLKNTESKANFDNYVPSGSSSSSSSFSESISPPTSARFQMPSASNTFIKQNEKFDQSATQNTYTSDSNIAVPGVYSDSGTSVSYSNSAYGNGYSKYQNFAQAGPSPVLSNSASQLDFQSHLNEFAQYNPPNQLNSQNQFSPSVSNLDPNHFTTSSSQTNTQNQKHDAGPQYNSQSPLNSPIQPNNNNQFSSYNQMSGQNQLNSQAYLNQMQQIQPAFKNNNNYISVLPESNSNYASSGSSSTFSPPSMPLSGYSSEISNKDYNTPAESNYNEQQKSDTPLPYSNQNIKEETSITTSNSSSLSKPSFTSSLSYSYTEKKSKPEKTYMIQKEVNKPSFNSQNNIKSQQNKDNFQTSSSNIQYSPQITEADIQSAKSKIDEMERHIQSSASSIINVYTNSPQSMSDATGQTFSFMDPEAMGSSQSATFFEPLDSDGNTKPQYSSEDLTIVPGPSYQDPAEPLQTSLDAYVPVRPPYQSSASDQNTVYKEAISETDEYKEAISLNTDSSLTKKS